MSRLAGLVLIAALACPRVSMAQPVRMYDAKGAPPFKVLKEGENPPLVANGNFVIGPHYVPAPERKKMEGVPEGKVVQFVIDSKETKLFKPGHRPEGVRQGRSEKPEDADRRDPPHRLHARDHGLHSRALQGRH
jgi:hypothetical protein